MSDFRLPSDRFLRPYLSMQLRHIVQWIALGGLAFIITACGKDSSESTTDSTPVAAPTEAVPAVAESVPSPTKAEPVVAELSLESADELASYGIGYNIGSSIAQDGSIEVDLDGMIAGLRDGLAGQEPSLDQEKIQSAMMELQQRAAEKAKAVGQGQLAKSTAFLEKNAQRPGVTVTPSGLQYEVMSASGNPDAAKPKATDTVEVHYHGTLIDGTVFDSSVERGESISFPLSGVIPGWTEALQLMSVGDKYKLYLPPSIAYGERQTGSIPANSALIFEVELISIVKPAEAPASAE